MWFSCWPAIFGSSVRHSGSGAPGETVTVAVITGDGTVRVEVTDRAGPGTPELHPAGRDAEGGAICDQIDRADAMLIEMRERAERERAERDLARRSHRLPQPTSPDASGQDPMALARYDPISRTWGFILDDTTAKAAVHAITVDAFEREARTREVHQDSRQFPQNSYGRQNRRIIAAREAGITARLRAVERAYRAALDPGAIKAIGLTRTLPAMDRASDRERELE